MRRPPARKELDAKPAPTDSLPTDPLPTDPLPTDPLPTDPLPAASDSSPGTSHAILRYTTMRVAIFLLALLLLWLVGVQGLLLVALALLISGLASFTLLAKQRDAMSIQVAAARDRRRQRAGERASREDAIADELAERFDHVDGESSDARAR